MAGLYYSSERSAYGDSGFSGLLGGLTPQGFYSVERQLPARALPDGFPALSEALAAVIEEIKS